MTAADALATAYRHGPGRVIGKGPTPRLPPPAPATRVPLTDLAAGGRFGAALAHLLTDVATPRRWEPWNQYNDHRAYPSARSAFPVDVVLVADGGAWPLDPVRRALVGGAPARLGSSVRLDLVRRRERFSTGYGEFADVLVELEVGHLIAALADHAAQLGLRAQVGGDGLVVSSDRETGEPGPRPPVRSSGFGPRGVSADPRPLPASAFHAVATALPRPANLRHRLAVHNVVGVPDGWYDGPRLIAEGPAMDQVRATYGHAPNIVDVGSANLALVITGDPADAVAAEGPDGYRGLLRAAGACAQRVCAATAEAGLFCRPVRSVHDEDLEALVRAPAGHTVLYLLVAGRPRATGFTYDLTPLEA
ncbi:hypothetical protein B0I31_12547 [Saccharothrix carnea]|uniref:Nitroreductase family protein n=1 Tax=Saccharothrix carnea TaxID=1280637 RepID=A0A2P8HLR6_SACCR|nr:hypothetical protein [Saccharothrix carnea]PSL47140.1 hypothetical protein B0I31_12547 [Saccharothrix carnea]